MKTILVPTDFSLAALNAANYASDMALAIHADLFLLHVYQSPVIYSEVPIALNEVDMMKSAERDINLLKAELTKKTGGKVNINTDVRMGIFFHELKSACERLKPYTVIMGSQGTTSAERLLFGSHSVYAMKHLMWPLITVPPNASFSSIKKIGLACDFNEVVDTIPVEDIKLLVNDFNAELHVLNTGKERVFDPDLIFESGMLQEMIEDLKPVYDFISSENIDEGIIDFAEINKLDLLVILPKRHSLFERMIHKSHSKQIVLHSLVPVLALHQH